MPPYRDKDAPPTDFALTERRAASPTWRPSDNAGPRSILELPRGARPRKIAVRPAMHGRLAVGAKAGSSRDDPIAKGTADTFEVAKAAALFEAKDDPQNEE